MFLFKYKKIYDLRTSYEIMKYGRLPLSTQISLAELKYKFENNLIDKNDKILLYCSSSKRSSYGLHIAESYGYKNIEELQYGYNIIHKVGLAKYIKVLKL